MNKDRMFTSHCFSTFRERRYDVGDEKDKFPKRRSEDPLDVSIYLSEYQNYKSLQSFNIDNMCDNSSDKGVERREITKAWRHSNERYQWSSTT